MDKLTWNELDNAELEYNTLLTRATRDNPTMMELLHLLYRISPQMNERIRYLGALTEASQKHGNIIINDGVQAIYRKWDVDHLFRQVLGGIIT